MKRAIVSRTALATCLLALAGCATSAEIAELSDPVRGFETVSATSEDVIGKQSVWIQSHEAAEATSARVHRLIHRKTVTADQAVQVALLSNKGLQAAYADVGISAADVWQEALPANPKLTVEFSQIGIGRTIESLIAANIARALTRNARMDVADARLRKAQLEAIAATLRVAQETRVAWINAVAGWEKVGHIRRAIEAADAGSELAQQLGETGAASKTAQAREHVNYAELTTQLAAAKLEAREAKQALIRKMGVWGKETEFQVPNRLPPLPSRAARMKNPASAALRKRIDLAIAKANLEILARSYGLTDVTRYVSDLDIEGGVEIEREEEEGEKARDVVSGIIGFDFVLPIFDSGEARLRKAELAYMRAANVVAQKAAEIRSEANSAYESYRGRYEIARHHMTAVEPLRRVLEEQALLNNNGMITSTFELLQDVRAKANSDLQAAMAKRDFWLSEANLKAAVYGAGGVAGSGGSMAVVADAGGGGDH